MEQKKPLGALGGIAFLLSSRPRKMVKAWGGSQELKPAKTAKK
ncbi:MAG: hypothetical protein VB085_13415 [Peptococcaceae bacterium]|nr:hypothetical protein [Peptococcaceae bacterium]